jgi:hypothetical protein
MTEEAQEQNPDDLVGQSDEVFDDKSERNDSLSETRKEPTVTRGDETNQCAGPKNDRELEIAVKEIRQQFAHAGEAFELSDETKRLLGEKMNVEIAQTHERMFKYQELLQEGKIARANDLIDSVGGRLDSGIKPFKQFNPSKQERFLVQKGRVRDAEVVFKVGESSDKEAIQDEARNLRVVERASSELDVKPDIHFVRQEGDVFENEKMCGLATEYIQDDPELKRNLTPEQKVDIIGKTIDNLQRLPVADEARESGVPIHDGEKIVRDAQYFLGILSQEGRIDAENCKALQEIFSGARPLLVAEKSVFVHGDAHGDNIYIKKGKNGELDISLLDFEGLRISNQYHDWSEILNKSSFLKHLQANRPELFEPIKGNVENMWLDASVIFDEKQIIDRVAEGNPDKARNFRLTRIYDMLTRIMNDRNSENPLAQERTRLYLEYIQKEVQ